MNKKQLINKIFKDMKAPKTKPWRTTTCKFVHKDRRKEANKKACRKVVQW